MAVSRAVSISVIGLIIDASIPAGAGQSAKNTAVNERRRRGIYIYNKKKRRGIWRERQWNKGEQEKAP